MACQTCLIAGVFIVIMLLCTLTYEKSKPHDTSSTTKMDDDDTSDNKTKYVPVDPAEQQLIKPPIVGQPFGDYESLPESRYDARKFMELPRGGLSCANKRWYDSIYNGGIETIINMDDDSFRDTPGVSKIDVRTMWKEDAVARRRENRLPRMIKPARHGMMV